MTRLAALMLTGVLISVAIDARQQPARDLGGAPSLAAANTGTGVITGTIVTDDAAAKPVRRATVTLAGSAAAAQRVAISGDDGRFAFTQLPSGSFSITADKPAYVRLYYGGKRPGRGPGVPVALADGQHLDLTMKMLHGAAITGTVLEPSGRPAAQLSVETVVRPGAGATRTAPSLIAGAAMTDDRGVYRIFGLAPGEYVVFALPRGAQFNSDLHAVTAEDVQWAQGRVSGALPASAPLPPSEPAVGYTRVYFPGTTNGSDAGAVTLGAGEERNASFTLEYVSTARIDGTVTDPNGQPAQSAQVQLVPKMADPIGSASPDPGMRFCNSDRAQVTNGKFALLAVAPGSYTIAVRGGPAASDAAGRAGGRPGVLPFATGPGWPGPPWWGEADITVDGHDQANLSIALQPAMTLTGTLAFDGTTPPPTPLTRVRIYLLSADTRTDGDTSVQAGADGHFVIPNVIPGRYKLRTQLTDAAWALKSAMVDEHDVADAPFVISPGKEVTAVVTFTDRPTDISGVLYDAAGHGTPEFSIVVFSTDRATWTAGSRRIRATRPNSKGAFDISGLPPGEYFLTAVSDYDPQDLSDPAFLEQLAAAPYKITLADGEHKTQDLKIAGGGIS